jgi:hypothetical protein
MNHRNVLLAPTATGCFLSRLLHDRMGHEASLNVRIISDNARTVVRKRPLRVMPKSSNERLDKVLQHIASRWGDSPEERRHDQQEVAKLRPVPRKSAPEHEKVTRDLVSDAGAHDRWSKSCTNGTIQGLEGQQEKAVSMDSIKCRSNPLRYSDLPLSQLTFSKSGVHTIHGKDMECKYARALHFTAKAVSISSSSPSMPRRRKSHTRMLTPINVTTPTFITRSPSTI